MAPTMAGAATTSSSAALFRVTTCTVNIRSWASTRPTTSGKAASSPPPPSISTPEPSPAGLAYPTARSSKSSPTSPTSAPHPTSAFWANARFTSRDEDTLAFQGKPALGFQGKPALGSQGKPALGSQGKPALGSQGMPALGSQAQVSAET